MTEAAAKLLPPNATPFERALAVVAGEVGNVPVPLSDLFDPQTCPMEILPWLAWENSVDSWDSDWTEAAKRDAVAKSIDEHRRKGTRISVEAVLARFDELLSLVEWHEASPRKTPHTFEVFLPLVTEPGADGGPRTTATFAEAIVREVSRVKPLREHFQLVQTLMLTGGIGLQGVARLVEYRRDDMVLVTDTSLDWGALLQNEDGEPLQADDDSYLETTP